MEASRDIYASSVDGALFGAAARQCACDIATQTASCARKTVCGHWRGTDPEEQEGVECVGTGDVCVVLDCVILVGGCAVCTVSHRSGLQL